MHGYKHSTFLMVVYLDLKVTCHITADNTETQQNREIKHRGIERS
jgi:hypothetical protein